LNRFNSMRCGRLECPRGYLFSGKRVRNAIDVKKLLENPALKFFAELTAARLKRAGVTLSEDLGLPTPKSDPNRGFSPELIRKLAGG
jgi:hypothetical protein